MFEVNYSGKEERFETLAEAIDFSDSLTEGSDIWADGELYRTKIKNYFTGEFEVEVIA